MEPAAVSNSLPVKTNVKHRLEYARRAYSDGEIIQTRRRQPAVGGRKIWRSRARVRPRKIVIIGDMNTGKSSLITAYIKDQFTDIYTPTILRTFSTDAIIKTSSISSQQHKVDLIIVDTPGRKDYQQIRTCAYHNVDLIIICFALDKPETLHQVKDYWIKEVHSKIYCKKSSRTKSSRPKSSQRKQPQSTRQRNNKSIPVILIGTCQDKRDELFTNWCQCTLCTSQNSGCAGLWNNNNICHDDQEQLKDDIVSHKQGALVAEEIGALLYLECSAKYRIGVRNAFEQATLVAMKKYRRKRTRVQSEGQGCIIL